MKNEIKEFLEVGKAHFLVATKLSKCNLVIMAISEPKIPMKKYLLKMGLDVSLNRNEALKELKQKVSILKHDVKIYFENAKELFNSMDNLNEDDKIEVDRIWSSIIKNNENIIQIK